MSPFEAFLQCGSVSTDTRNIVPGSVFFALKGARFNGNEFALQALEQGAAYAVVDETVGTDSRLIQVDDVLEALQQTSAQWRKHLGIPIVGLTGSNGKTTNKELFHAVLSQKYRTMSTPGNLNNHIGVPLTLLSFTADTEVGIVEMGANHCGEIALLCDICQPTIGYITNFGKAHLEGFGGIEGVIEGKSELYAYLRKTTGQVLLNTDEPKMVERAQGIQAHSFGTKGDEQLTWRNATAGEFASIAIGEQLVSSHLSGEFNCTNMAAAMALGQLLGVSQAKAAEAIASYVPSMNRAEWKKTAHNKVQFDAYNANPTSMRVSVENFAQWYPEGILVLGDMFELGEYAKAEHQAIVAMCEELRIPHEQLFLVGQFFAATSGIGQRFGNTSALLEFWQKNSAPKGATLLLKGSRGIALEQLEAVL